MTDPGFKLQFRPTSTETIDTPMYAPHRDLGVMGTHLVYNAVHLLEDCNHDAALTQFITQTGTTPTMLAEAVVGLRDAFEQFPVGATIEDAMLSAGYMDTPANARIAVERCIGRLCLAMIWHGLKDRATPGERPRGVQDVIDAITSQLGLNA